MNVMLTGGSGFIGKRFSKQYGIKRYVIRSEGKRVNLNDFIVPCFSSSTKWDGAFDEIDVIVHLAGLAHSNLHTTSDYKEVNIDGTLHFARSAAKAGVKRFVFVSSVGVNGLFTLDAPFSLESKPNPHSAYAASKYEAELELKKIALKTGLEVVIVRPTLVYGAEAPGNFGILTRLVDKLPCLPFGLVNNRRSFISVDNLSDILITCVSNQNAAGHTFLASENETVSTKEFTNAIAKGLGKKIYQLPVPVNLMRFAGKLLGKSAMVEQLVGNLQVDSSDLKKVLGWTPPYTMEESMALLKEQNKERE